MSKLTVLPQSRARTLASRRLGCPLARRTAIAVEEPEAQEPAEAAPARHHHDAPGRREEARLLLDGARPYSGALYITP